MKGKTIPIQKIDGYLIVSPDVPIDVVNALIRMAELAHENVRSGKQNEQEIQERINKTAFMTGGNTDVEKDLFDRAAKFGFSMAEDRIAELEDGLKDINGRVSFYEYPSDVDIVGIREITKNLVPRLAYNQQPIKTK